jgi:group II intron reverse transcriptase/maturase
MTAWFSLLDLFRRTPEPPPWPVPEPADAEGDPILRELSPAAAPVHVLSGSALIRIQEGVLMIERPDEPVVTHPLEQVSALHVHGWAKVSTPAIQALLAQGSTDGVTIAGFELRLDENLGRLASELRNGRYRPGKLRRAVIVRPDGKRRKLAIPGIRDRVVQTAALVVIAPALDPRLSESSFGYRPGRGVADAIAAVEGAFAAGRVWTLDADVTRYFDRVPHRRLLEELTIWLDQEGVIRLFALWLRSFSPIGPGIAQGAPISPLLANLFLHPLDRLVAAAGCTMVRYADDFVLLAASERELGAARAMVASVLRRRGLALNAVKTRVVPPGRDFTFLGEALRAPSLPLARHAVR